MSGVNTTSTTIEKSGDGEIGMSPRVFPPGGFPSLRFVHARFRLNSHLDDLEGEHEYGSGGDVRTHLPVAVRDLARDDQLPFVALLHELHRLGPAGDDLVGRELGGLAALVGRVELLPVDRGAAVVAGAASGGARARSPRGPFHEDAVLEPGRELDHPILELVGLEVRDALGGGGGVGGAREGEKREEREDVVDAGHDAPLLARDLNDR
mmetsp:Transcript_6631/g.29200  ORF Transcript_6631/g.29200 Transcript_6631/m.29200 type:complete len:209 (-) Transcript_6631:8-634(-)